MERLSPPELHRDQDALPETAGPALTLLLISGNEVGQRAAQHHNVIEAARKAGAKRIIYTSLLRADASPLNLAPEHVQTEAAPSAERHRGGKHAQSCCLRDWPERRSTGVGNSWGMSVPRKAGRSRRFAGVGRDDAAELPPAADRAVAGGVKIDLKDVVPDVPASMRTLDIVMAHPCPQDVVELRPAEADEEIQAFALDGADEGFREGIGVRRPVRDPEPPPLLLTSPALRLTHEPVADCARYDLLRRAS